MKLLILVMIYVASFISTGILTSQNNISCSLIGLFEKYQYYIIDEELHMKCECSCSIIPLHYQIVKNSHSLEDENRTMILDNFKSARKYFEVEMIIRNVIVSDSGQYGIRFAFDDYVIESSPVNVSVFPEPDPVCLTTPKTYYFGDSVTIQCHIFSYPDVSLQSFSSDTVQSNDNGFINKSGDIIIFEREFKISDELQEKDFMSEYTCNVQVKSKSYICTIGVPIKNRLNVSLEITPDHLIVGQKAVLKCSLHGGNISEVPVVEYQYIIWTSYPSIDMLYINDIDSILLIFNVTKELNGTEVRCTVNGTNNSEGSEKVILNVIDKSTTTRPANHLTIEHFFSKSIHPATATTKRHSVLPSPLQSHKLKIIFSITFVVFIIFAAIVSTKYIKSRNKHVPIGTISAIANIGEGRLCAVELEVSAPDSVPEQIKWRLAQQLLQHKLPDNLVNLSEHNEPETLN